MVEVWKKIKDYEDYEVCTDGRIKSRRQRFYNNPRILKPHQHKNGYCLVTLVNEIGYKELCIHRVVAKAFLPDYSEDLQVDHINGVRNDNRLENLRMCTHHENNWGEGFSGVEVRRDKLVDMNKKLKSKAVRQYSIETGEFIAEYYSGNYASRWVIS